MYKRVLIAILLVYLAWFGLDFVIHQLILGGAYAATAQFWRPMEEMKMGLMQIVSVVAAASFVLVYALVQTALRHDRAQVRGAVRYRSGDQHGLRDVFRDADPVLDGFHLVLGLGGGSGCGRVDRRIGGETASGWLSRPLFLTY